MKRLFFLLLLLPLVTLAQNGFTIKGAVTGFADGAEIKVTSSQDENAVVATGRLKSNAFQLSGQLPEPGLYYLTIGNAQPQHIFMENSAIQVSGSKQDIKNLKITGSAAHKDFEVFRTTFNPLIGELSGLAARINKATKQDEYDALMLRYDSLAKSIQAQVGQFVQSRPASFVSPFLLYVTAQIAEDPLLMEGRFNSLSPVIKESQIGKSLASFIAYSKVGAVGTDAIDFVQNTADGQPVSLASFKGKWVLVDFWASWCGPCRVENPNVVAAYHRFKDNNFTVLGVSLDREKEAWLKAVEADKLTWTQVSDLQFWNNTAAQLYRVQGIPFNFLVDPQGKIVAKNLRGEALAQTLEKLLRPLSP